MLPYFLPYIAYSGKGVIIALHTHSLIFSFLSSLKQNLLALLHLSHCLSTKCTYFSLSEPCVAHLFSLLAINPINLIIYFSIQLPLMKNLSFPPPLNYFIYISTHSNLSKMQFIHLHYAYCLSRICSILLASRHQAQVSFNQNSSLQPLSCADFLS